MLNQIIQFSIKNKLIILLSTAGLVGFGVYELTKLPIDAVPDITDNQVQVITITPALGAPDVERLITFPIEQANTNIPGLKEIRSFSRFGLSLVTIVFDDNVDLYWARQQVNERLQQVRSQLPEGFGSPELAPVTTGLGEIFQYVIRPKPGYESKYDPMELRTIQDWIVRRQLLGTPGVADVSSFGGYLKQYEISVNPDLLQSYHVTIKDLFTALQNNNENTGGAYIEKGPTVLFIRSEGLVRSLDDIANIVVRTTDKGIPIFVHDVAVVRYGSAPRYGAVTYNDQGEVVGAIVMMLKGANSSDVVNRVKERVAQIEKTLPEGVIIEPFLDRTKMVYNAISTVTTNLVEGALIVVFVLVLFLGNLRAGMVVASVIPLSMFFAVIMMNLFGVSGNLMSLGAIDFGLIVDGAVIIVEAVMHGLTHSKHFKDLARIDQSEMDEEVKISASRLMNAAVFGQIIILIVYLPILTLEGIEGKMFRPMAQTVSFAIVGAFILSLTYVPMMSALFLSKKISNQPSLSARVLARLERFYQHRLEKVLTIPKATLLVSVSLFAASLLVMNQLGGEFIPELEEGDFAADTRVLTGSNLHTTINATQQASAILLKNFPEVEKVVTKIGSGEIPTDPMPIEASDMMIILKDKREWTTASSFDELANKMNEKLQDIPGISIGFSYPVQMRFNELMTGAKQDVVCKIYGEDLDTLSLYAMKLGDQIKTVEGAKELYVESVTGMQQIVVKYDRATIAKFGLNIKDINDVLNTAFAGQSAGFVYEGERRFDLVVRLANTARQSINDVRNLLIRTPRGEQIPLHTVADVAITEGPNQIQRDDAKRRVVVGFNVRNRDIQTTVNELQDKVGKNLHLPAGYYVTYGGTFEKLVAARERGAVAVPIALLLIFLMLYFAFNSIREGLLIYTAIPLSAIGGIFALWIRGMPFSISAGVGFIALFGVAVLNGIVLISEFNRLQKEGWDDLRRVVLMGTKIRLRPVLMTAAVASLGFLPMALSRGAGAEVQRPLATVVIGGLISATLLTLFVLPVLFVMFGGKKKSGTVRNIATTASLIALMLLGTASAFAQNSYQPISLQQSSEIAENNNLTVQSANLRAQYFESLKGTSLDFGKTEITADYGQINSAAKDNRFAISQAFSFPTVYFSQAGVNRENWLSAVSNAEWQKAQMKAEVKKTFYELLVMQQKQKLLQSVDSIYAEFQTKADLRYKTGETNLLEKTTAEMQRAQIANQLQGLRNDYRTLLRGFWTLLNTPLPVEPKSDELKYPFSPIADTSAIVQSALLQSKLHQRNAAEYNSTLEWSKLLPSFSIGYNDMSIIGWQRVDGTDTYFDKSSRFSSITVGVQIPLFFWAQTSRIQAANANEQLEQTNFVIAQQQMRAHYLNAYQQWEKNQTSVRYYETIALNNANTIVSTANLQLDNGAISYIEWVLLVNQGVSLRTEYLNAVQQLNQSAVDLELISTKQ